ncbi:MAG: uL15 family ribosomal protein [Thermoproteales archaeon]|nr:uL15 family ribosomal protein [Thermoproteales archaeon]
MSVRSKKKSRYQRGSRTCGWGRTGQHRRSGSRGGRGRVGYHKHKWTWVVKYAPDWFGKHGFTRHPSLVPRVNSINVGEICERLNEWLKAGIAEETKDGKIFIDVTKLGYNKVLGEGEVNKAIIVKAVYFTKKAIEKIRNAGGDIAPVKEV